MRTISARVAQRCAPTGLSGVTVALSSSFSVSGSCAIVVEPAGRPGVGDPRRAELRAVERGALEEVGELPAVARVVDRELLGPRQGLDLGREHQPPPSRRLVGDRLLGPPAMQEPDRLLALLGEVGEEAGRAREQRHRLDGRGREAEVEHDRRDRDRDVHRERLAPGLRDRSRNARASSDVRPADPALVGELEDPLGARVDRLVHRVPEARELAARRADAPASPRRRPRLAPGDPLCASASSRRTARRCRG